MTTKKLDIIKVLDAVSKKRNVLENLNDEEIKSIQPFVLMRWLSGSTDAKQVYFLNEFVNPYVFQLSKHKQLLCHLLTVCTPGKSQRYKWNPPISNVKAFPQISDMLSKYFNCKQSEAYEMITLLSDEDILNYASELGYQTEDVSKIRKELKSRTN